MIQLQNLSHGYSGKLLYENLNFTFKPNVKYALVGVNGIGKSTLFNILSEQISSNKGSVSKPKNLSIEYLAQELETEETLTVLELALSSFSDVFKLEKDIQKLNETLSNTTDERLQEKLLDEVSELTEKFENQDGYILEAQAKKILAGLGFANDEYTKKLSLFSGGWRMRANLAKMLLKSPDFLLLDEPTNHLDIVSLKWLENFLNSYQNSVVIISHDRIFLDNIVSRTLELTPSNLTEFAGNYSYYEEEKETRLLQLESENDKKQREINHILTFVNRFRYKATKAKQVQSRLKMLEKLGLNKFDEKQKSINLSFHTAEPSGKVVFEFENLSKSYDKEILKKLSGTIYREDRIAILGPNGAGKSTFLKLLMGKTQPTSGTITLGQKTNIGYYAQHQLDELNKNNSVFEEVQNAAIPEKKSAVRDVLGALLFSGDDIEKQISVLSGGEKARVALSKLLVSPANTLVLDEPTNHLDIHSKEALQLALDQFNGTLIIISHDREFIDGLVENYFYFDNKTYQTIKGTFSDFEEKVLNVQEAKPTKQNDIKQENKVDFKVQKRLKNVKNKLAIEVKEIEHSIDTKFELQKNLQDKQYSETDNIEVQKLQDQIETILQDIVQLEELWETKSNELESLD